MVKKKRRYLLYFGVELVTESVNVSINITSDSKLVSKITGKINSIYAVEKVLRNE